MALQFPIAEALANHRHESGPIASPYRLGMRTTENTTMAGYEQKLDREVSATTEVRMPCRGCLPDCAEYATCEGRPWRSTGKPLDEARFPATEVNRGLAC